MIYKSKPKDFKSAFEVVSCFIEVNDTILLLKRVVTKPEGNKWGVPAGKVNGDEDLEAALIREVFEETSIEMEKKDLKYFDKFFVRYPDKDFVYHIFSIKLDKTPNVVIRNTEHQEYTWENPKKAITLDLIMDEDECIKAFYK